MLRRIASLSILAFLFAASPTAAKAGLPKQFLNYGDVKLQVVPDKARAGETVIVRLTIEVKPGVHTYPFFPIKYPDQSSKNILALPKPNKSDAGDLIFLKGVNDPAVPTLVEKREVDPETKQVTYYEYYPSTVTWEFKAVVSPNATPGEKTVHLGDTRVQVCTDAKCIFASGDQLPSAKYDVLPGASDKTNPDDLAAARKLLDAQPPPQQPIGPTRSPDTPRAPGPNTQPAPPIPAAATEMPSANNERLKKTAKPIEEYTAELESIGRNIHKADTPGGSSLWGFVLTAAAWGLISLVTPCVFPMIPITVSIFLKHAHGSLRERLKLAGVYCLTIIAVLGVSAFALLKFMAMLSANPVTNILLGLLFLVLALSLFGMYEIMLPSFLSRRLQAKQAKGGVIGTVFSALAFTVISFTCVAPFLGGFAGISSADAASGSLISLPTSREIAGGLAFATAFAAPFFVLALIPGLLKALPRSGGWLDSVKVVMGFLELAAALKFLRTAEVRILPASEYFTYDLVLGGWVAISFACGLYLLNIYRLPHDEEKPNIGVMRLLFAILFLGLGVYLMPAMFKGSDGKAQRPSGAVYAWVEAFLLPEGTSGEWGTDLKAAIEQSRKSGQPVLVDFTGKTCTNCKYNEHYVFPRPEIQKLFEKFERVQLYTDEVPELAYTTDPGYGARSREAKANGSFQDHVFGDIALPLYAVLVLKPDGGIKVLNTYDGKINDPSSFTAWLEQSLKEAKE